jgi:hypothetical protein
VQISPLAASPQKPGAQPQLLAAVLPFADAAFAPHLVHALLLAVLANESAGQTAHTALPVALLYVPGPHPVQGPPSLPAYPTEQMHAVTATLPVTDTLEPDGHFEHSAEPCVATYVPTGHAEHAAEPVTLLCAPALHAVQLSPPDASPVKPAAHAQLMPPSTVTAFTGQLVHTAEPTPLLYVPASHATQLAALAASPVKPASHAQTRIDVVDVLPSAETAIICAPGEQPQNARAGRCSPISATKTKKRVSKE